MKSKLIIITLIFTILQQFECIAQKELTNEYKEITIKKVSQLIKEHYVLKSRRGLISEKINNILSNGSYNEIKDFKSFGQQLTNDLHEISGDYHFAVVYDPTKVAAMKNEDDEESDEKKGAEYQKKILEQRKRNNFGIRRVEILDGNIGYLDLRFFRGDSLALETAHEAMAFLSNSDAIILDLRKNLGGGAAMLQLLSSYFFGQDSVLLGEIYNGLSDQTQQLWTNPEIPRCKISDLDLYILTSKETFSAAEEFAYDLKQLKRATIVGESTGGGAHMVTRMIVNDEFYIYMPFAGAINPITKTNWEGIGVQPDFKVPTVKALNKAHILAIEKLIEKTSDEEYKLQLQSILEKMIKEY